jgi:glycosyltransferase involved in cell wall biosynthesis
VGRVSAIVCVRDGERYIGEAVDSILAQTEPPAEIVIVDDGSQDDSAAIAEGYGEAVHLIRTPPRGQAAALNTGLEGVAGELIAFLDSDDLWTARKLELQRETLARNPELDMVFGQAEEFISPDLAEEERAKLRATERPVPAKLKGTMLIRSEAMRRVGPFTTGWSLAEFVEWYVRAQEARLTEEMLGEVVLRRRLHKSNIGRRLKDARPEYALVMAQHLRRRRTRGEGP